MLTLLREVIKVVHDNSEKLLLRVDEAAARLSVSRASLYRLLTSGRLRAVRVGRATRIPARELERFVRELQGGGSDET
jgi:excisionase family DNA binding protein